MIYSDILAGLSQYSDYFKWLGVAWLASLFIGLPVMYVGYGFAMSAQRAKQEGLSQRRVVFVDTFLTLLIALLDFYLNIVVFSVLCLDFKPKNTFTMITQRLSRYSLDTQEKKFRKSIADFVAAFLDGKDPSGDHIKGRNFKFKSLD
jgi:hypothetical protein